MKNKIITNLKAEHNQEILKIQINYDNEISVLKSNLTDVTLLKKIKENQNHELLEALEIIHNLKEEMAKMKDYYYLRYDCEKYFVLVVDRFSNYEEFFILL
jgi:hypothetical protein